MSSKSEKKQSHKPKKSKNKSKSQKKKKLRRDKFKEIENLIEQVKKNTPPPGVNPFHKKPKKSQINQQTIQKTKFSELPISKRTKDGLKEAGFTTMTEIQSACILHALAGRDILGAAKTGSGKTLAFLIPVVENLYRLKWSKWDGLGALIITPSRELALQIFEVLRTFAKYHCYSAGLVVGGNKNFEEEKQLIGRMNIVVGTPGRILQHMDSSYGFNCDNLQILVLDEADRLLEMGFETELSAIIENLPKSRQTLLFSATQTKSVKSLQLLSLKKDNTEYISVHEQEVVPKKLKQSYIVCELYEKVDVLFSFIQSHLRCKIIVFLTSTKQVSFLSQVFMQLNIGIAVCRLHGRMSQKVRRENYEEFLGKRYAVLFATDVAARGLDFPKVDFVIQLDQPISPELYIHRAGRTARYTAQGNAIIFLAPQELEFVELLKKRKIDIVQKKINLEKVVSIQQQLSAIIAHDVKLKYLAMKYYESYVLSLSKGCTAVKVDINSLPLKKFARRLGLVEQPQVKLNSVPREKKFSTIMQKLKEKLEEVGTSSSDDSDDSSADSDESNESDEEEDEQSENESETEDSESDDEEMSDVDETTVTKQKDDELSLSDEDDGYTGSDEAIDDDLDDLIDDKKKKKRFKSKIEKLLRKNNITQFTPKYSNLIEKEESDDEFFTIKRLDHDLDDDIKGITPYVNKRKILNVNMNKKILFGDDGKPMTPFEKICEDIRKQTNIKAQQEKYAQEIRERIEQREAEDKALDKQRVREKRLKKKLAKKELQKLKEEVLNLHEGIMPAADREATVTLAHDTDEDIEVAQEVEENPFGIPEYKPNNKRKLEESAEEEPVSKKQKSDE